MHLYYRGIWPILVLSLVLGTAGCVALLIGGGAAVGAGTVAYVRGELKSTEAVSLDRAGEAAMAAIKELQFRLTSRSKDALTDKLVARSAEDKKVTILLKRVTDTLTDIRIRVGFFGNESLSRLILEKMKKYL